MNIRKVDNTSFGMALKLDYHAERRVIQQLREHGELWKIDEFKKLVKSEKTNPVLVSATTKKERDMFSPLIINVGEKTYKERFWESGFDALKRAAKYAQKLNTNA